jgi:hypothetical protein
MKLAPARSHQMDAALWHLAENTEKTDFISQTELFT